MNEPILSCDAMKLKMIGTRAFGWLYGGEVREFVGAQVVDHGQDEGFDLLGLNLGFGQELGGAEA
jgi:hypothetical protein